MKRFSNWSRGLSFVHSGTGGMLGLTKVLCQRIEERLIAVKE
jgi:hypothetical protein